MSDKRYSLWQVIFLIAAFLGVAALSCGAGLTLGFRWGKDRGRAELFERGLGFLEELNPRSLLDRLPIPELPFGRERDQPIPDFPFREERDQPYLGVSFHTITPELAADERLPTEEGALVTQVIEGSPAERAGLEPGDIIIAVEGEFVWSGEPLAAHILAYQPGDRLELEILRDGRDLILDVRLGRAPSN
jgi:membrane-associated protease RseP (regulator of RpoE activity)